MMGARTGSRRTVVNYRPLYLTVQDGCPWLTMRFAGNMGYGIDAVDRKLAEIGIPSIEDMREGCPSFRESGSPDYRYEAQVLIGDLSPMQRNNLEIAVRESQEERQAKGRRRQRKALSPRARALVTRAKGLVDERDGVRQGTGRRSWEERAEQVLRDLVAELG